MLPEMNREELDLVLDTLNRFSKKRLDDQTLLALDEQELCPTDILQELMGPEVGIHLAFIPTAYGGMGGGAKAIFRICEAVAGVDLGVATSLLGVSLGTDPLRVGGTDEQKEKWMTKIAEDGLLVAYAVTEPSAGSDLASIRTKAVPVVKDGKTVAYRIDGSKQFITNGGLANLYTVLAMAPGGPTFFVVERGTPGLEPGPSEHKHGIRASNTTSLSLEGVEVPVENLIGGVEGQGLAQAQRVFGYTRVMVAAFGLACGEAAMQRALEYGSERIQDGSTLTNKPAWTHKLIVPHATALQAARSFIEQLTDRLDAGEPDLATQGAVAKLVATEYGNAAAEAAIQAHGGYGYIHDYVVEKIKRDVRITCIYEGTSEILQRTIAREGWRRHLQTRGRYYLDMAEEMVNLEKLKPGTGALMAGSACRVLAETLEVARRSRLTRHQHVLFQLGWMMARTEVACAFARKAASGNPDSSKLSADCLVPMSRLWSRRVATEVSREGLDVVGGADALAGDELRAFEERIGIRSINDGLVGQLADLDTVAKCLIDTL